MTVSTICQVCIIEGLIRDLSHFSEVQCRRWTRADYRGFHRKSQRRRLKQDRLYSFDKLHLRLRRSTSVVYHIGTSVAIGSNLRYWCQEYRHWAFYLNSMYKCIPIPWLSPKAASREKQIPKISIPQTPIRIWLPVYAIWVYERPGLLVREMSWWTQKRWDETLYICRSLHRMIYSSSSSSASLTTL